MESSGYVKKWKACSQTVSEPGEPSDRAALQQEIRASDTTLRTLFSSQRDSWEVLELENPEQFLVPAFGVHDPAVFSTSYPLPEEADVPKVFALSAERRLQPGTATIVSQAQFLRNFELFSEGMLRYLDWSNVFAAGGGVLACLQPIPTEFDDCNRSRRKYFHDQAYPGSDIDLFLYGLDAEGARRKIVKIYDAVRESCPYDSTCFRSAHAISVVTQYPYRHVQVVLRLYSSPCEVLAGFDVDSCALGFDGKQVWISPRCHQALVLQRNPVDLSRRSPTYEMRLAKYAKRGFEVLVPGLDRQRVSPMLFERTWSKVHGLAKLLLLEQLSTPEARFRYKEQHRQHQMQRPFSSSFAQKFHFQQMANNPWLAERMEGVRGGADASDYSTVFLPWGPGYNAKRCVRLMAAKDKLLNNPFLGRSKGRKYKLHPCFWGSATTVLEDCCPKDPPVPADADQAELAGFVRGPLGFIEDDPGRQMIGSFHPITEGDWVEGALLSPATEALVLAANGNDVATIKQLLQAPEELTPVEALQWAVEAASKADFFGRSALHVAVMSGCLQAVEELLQRGADLCAKMADGRTVLHLAVTYGRDAILDILLAERIRQMAAAAAAKAAAELHAAATEPPAGRGSKGAGDGAEDASGEEDEGDGDEDSDGDGGSNGVSRKKAPARAGTAASQPTVPAAMSLDLDGTDWSRRMTALHYALALGRVTLAEKLLSAGASATQSWASQADGGGDGPVLAPPLLLGHLCRTDPATAGRLLDLLVRHGCSLTQLDIQFQTYLHLCVERGLNDLLRLLLEAPMAAKLRELSDSVSSALQTPLMMAVSANNVEAVGLLLAAGAAPNGLDAAGCERARQRFVANGKVLRQLPTWTQNRLRNLQPDTLDAPLKVAVQQLVTQAAYADDGGDDEESEAEAAATASSPVGLGLSGPVVPELQAQEEAAALGGREVPDVAPPRRLSQQERRLNIIRQLLTSGARADVLETPSSTLTDLLQKTVTRQRQQYELIRQAATGKVPVEVLQGDAAAIQAWAQALVHTITGGAPLPGGLCPAAVEAFEAYGALQGPDSYLLASARAQLEQDQASFLVGVASIVASNPESQMRHLKAALEALRAAGGKTLRELQAAKLPLPEGATPPTGDIVDDASYDSDNTTRRVTDFINNLLWAPHKAFGAQAPSCGTQAVWLGGMRMLHASTSSGVGPAKGASIQYFLLPEPQVQEDSQVTYLKGGATGLLLPGEQQEAYHALFEAVWSGNITEVERLTTGGTEKAGAVDPEAAASGTEPVQLPLFAAVYNTWDQTPLALAVLRGDAPMAALLLKTAAAQYTPAPLESEEEDDDGDAKEGATGPKGSRISNYALIMALQNAADGGSSYDSDSDSSGGDSADNANQDADHVVAEAQQMQRDMAADAAARRRAVAGIKLDDDAVATPLECHADALSLLHWHSKLPSALLTPPQGSTKAASTGAAGPADASPACGGADASLSPPSPYAHLSAVWEALLGGADSATMGRLLRDQGLSLMGYWIRLPEALQRRPMVSTSPLVAAVLGCNPALVRVLMGGFEAAAAGGGAPLGAAAALPASEVLPRLLRWVAADSPTALEACVDLDRPDCLAVMVEYVGLAPFSISVNGVVVADGTTAYSNSSDMVDLAGALRRGHRRGHRLLTAAPGAVPPLRLPAGCPGSVAALANDGVQDAAAPAAPTPDVGQNDSNEAGDVPPRVESWTLLHMAAVYGATATAQWLLSKDSVNPALAVHCAKVARAGGIPADNLRRLAVALGSARADGVAGAADWVDLAPAVLAAALCRDVGRAAPPQLSGYGSSALCFSTGRPGGLTGLDVAILQDDAAMVQRMLGSLDGTQVQAALNRRPPLAPAPPPSQRKAVTPAAGATGYYNKHATPVKPAEYINTTPLQTAAYWQSGRCFELLLERGADYGAPDAVATERDWTLPTFLLAGHQQFMPAAYASYGRRAAQPFVKDTKAEARAVTLSLMTALLDRVAKDSADGGPAAAAAGVAALVSSQRGPTRASSLVVAAHRGLVDTVELMLRRMAGGPYVGPSLVAQDVCGRTVLHAAAAVAVRRGAPHMVQNLLAHEKAAQGSQDGAAPPSTAAAAVASSAGTENFVGATPLDMCLHLLLLRTKEAHVQPQRYKQVSGEDPERQYEHTVAVLHALLEAHPEQRRSMPSLAQIQASRQHFTAVAQAAAAEAAGGRGREALPVSQAGGVADTSPLSASQMPERRQGKLSRVLGALSTTVQP